MICEPQIECICDKCGADAMVTPQYKYRDYSGNNGYYACEDDDVLEQLNGWVIADDGKTYCDECA